MKAIALLLLIFIQSALANTPTEAVESVVKAIRAKDFGASWKCFATFENNFAEIEKTKQSLRDALKEGPPKGFEFKVIEEKMEGDCAVVIVKVWERSESSDLESGYLIKQGDEWKLLPNKSGWGIIKEVAKDKVKTYEKLEKWSNARKAELEKAAAGKPKS